MPSKPHWTMTIRAGVCVVIAWMIAGCSATAAAIPISTATATRPSTPTFTAAAITPQVNAALTEESLETAADAATPLAPQSTLGIMPVGDAARGEYLYRHGRSPAPACINCHAPQPNAPYSLGPGMAGIMQRAGLRVPGLSADEYLRQSILSPRVYTVPGYPNIMYPFFAAYLSGQDLADLIAYLHTL